ncbi:P10 [Xanthomonas phage phiL7]|uniref:p10 n=1 Tax=Xanthomonas phage phiL7 TaxID=538979 RepID=C4ML10_9CAUD|nr:P10 [Xanthomonas phage phiL7]ACE75750.1 P10 [Xanthomonas phage phiL7]
MDVSGVLAGLDLLKEHTESVTRTMAFETAAAVRDSAKGFVKSKTGNLKKSIYAAYVKEDSTDTRHVYAVSWARGKSKGGGNGNHGHLLEYGHWRKNVLVRTADGHWIATKEKLDTPVRVPARPFLRPGWDSVKGRLPTIAADAGRKRLAALRAAK